MSVAPVRTAAAVPPSLRNARRSIDPAIALSSENPARRPGIRWLRMPVGPGLDAIEHHAREALDAMHLAGRKDDRSEEHTSELQSLAYLVCRLLLEKKKKDSRD